MEIGSEALEREVMRNWAGKIQKGQWCGRSE